LDWQRGVDAASTQAANRRSSDPIARWQDEDSWCRVIIISSG
jgi:hypothetical protein